MGLVLPILGFMQFPRLPEQFFPPADRNQFQLELELPGTGAIAETELYATKIRQQLLKDPAIEQVAWFLGESAPPFYYNIIPDRKNTSRYGQAIVDVAKGNNTRQVIHRVQEQLDQTFPSVSTLARQLEQGPPFSAPIEVRIFGPNTEQLQRVGETVRLVLTQTPDVIHTRSNLAESLPKITFDVDEQQARFVGLDHIGIATEMSSMLEGVIGGSILEDTELMPVRVRVSDERRADLNQIVSMALLPMNDKETDASDTLSYRGIPLSAIAKLKLTVESGAINRLNGTRMNEVQAFIRAGVLPSKVQSAFEDRLATSGFDLPDGITITYAGAEGERNDAVGNLFVNGAILFTLMVATLVIALKSFRLTALLFLVAVLSVGFGLGSLAIAELSWGFMSIVGMMGMIGIAINDSIVVIAALRVLPRDRWADFRTVSECVLANTRHILATSLTTVAGFTPLRSKREVLVSSVPQNRASDLSLRLVNEEHGTTERAQSRQLKRGTSALILFLGLKADPRNHGFDDANYWIYDRLDHDIHARRNSGQAEGIDGAFVSFGSLRNPGQEPHTAQIISFSDRSAWTDFDATTWLRRGEAYEQRKQDYCELSTPLTVESFTGHSGGMIYGQACNADRFFRDKWKIKTSVRNLYLTGSDVGTPGVNGALMAGVMTAAKLLGPFGLARIMARAYTSN